MPPNRRVASATAVQRDRQRRPTTQKDGCGARGASADPRRQAERATSRLNSTAHWRQRRARRLPRTELAADRHHPGVTGRQWVTYDSNLMGDDRSCVIAHPGGRIADLPVHWSLDDWEQYAFLSEPDVGQVIDAPAKVRELWTGELDAMRAAGSLCVITCHPFLSGRLARLRAIADLIDAAHAHGDVEIARCDAIANRLLHATGH